MSRPTGSLKWAPRLPPVVPVTFDLYDTLVTADRPAEPWSAVEDALVERDVTVPADWETAYRSSHHDLELLRELSLVEHTRAALASRDVDPPEDVIHAALLDAFDGPVTVREGAVAALRAAGDRGPVGLLSNCSLPDLVASSLERATLPVEFDAVVTSVDCGWRKPHDRAFEAAAAALDTTTEDLLHVGDDPRTDGGATTAGVTVLLTTELPLVEVPARLEDWK